MTLRSLGADVVLRQGPSVGAVWAVYDLARQLGLEAALGSTRQGKLALWQILARVVDPGSRLGYDQKLWTGEKRRRSLNSTFADFWSLTRPGKADPAA